jgi:hypothetical protein
MDGTVTDFDDAAASARSPRRRHRLLFQCTQIADGTRTSPLDRPSPRGPAVASRSLQATAITRRPGSDLHERQLDLGQGVAQDAGVRPRRSPTASTTAAMASMATDASPVGRLRDRWMAPSSDRPMAAGPTSRLHSARRWRPRPARRAARPGDAVRLRVIAVGASGSAAAGSRSSGAMLASGVHKLLTRATISAAQPRRSGASSRGLHPATQRVRPVDERARAPRADVGFSSASAFSERKSAHCTGVSSHSCARRQRASDQRPDRAREVQ